MRTYTFEDLYQDHNVNAVADEYARLGASAADSSRGTSIDDWWDVNGIGVIVRPLTVYRRRRDALMCSVGVERFARMHFKDGWMQQKGVGRR